MELPNDSFLDFTCITSPQLTYSNISVTYPSSHFSTWDGGGGGDLALSWPAQKENPWFSITHIAQEYNYKHLFFPSVTKIGQMVMILACILVQTSARTWPFRTEFFFGLPLQANAIRVPKIRPLLLPFSSFPIHYSLIIPPLNAM
jgi:hypothetical protein